ncbi:MAG TPA: transcription-repair coupling factor [Clostridiales bacterium]|nr:MAG: transcription-repair coupling factor [Clostridiales bacterium GWD2_32_19]HCC07144.1 transcription-repair coupling factor [Clostridiales bacterium]
MQVVLNEINNLKEYKKINEKITENKFPITINGVLGSAKAHLISALYEHTKKSCVILTSNELNVKRIYEDIKNFGIENVRMYPCKDVFFYNAEAYSFDIIDKRIEVMNVLMSDKPCIIIMSADALLDKIVRREKFEKYVKSIAVGDKVEFEKFISELIYMGYERAEMVESKGEFAVRGGIVDIYPVAANNMLRIEFWDDDIDSIREVNPDTQRSLEKLDKAIINPAKDIVFDKERLDKAIEKIKQERDSNTPTKDINIMIDTLKNSFRLTHSEKLVNYLYDDSELTNILSYFSTSPLVFLDEPMKVKQKCEIEYNSFTDIMKERLLQGAILPSQLNIRYKYEDAIEILNKYNLINMTLLYGDGQLAGGEQEVNMKVKSIDSFSKNFKVLDDNLKHYKDMNYCIVLYTRNATSMNNMKEELRGRGFNVNEILQEDEKLDAGAIYLAKGNLNTGFEYPEIKFVVLSEYDIFVESNKKNRKTRKTKGKKIESFTDLKLGDYVVHDQHGIGIYKGIEKITVEDTVKDYIKIEYRDGGSLYISISQMDYIQKYIGSEGKGPKVNKLDTAEWKNTKQKVKKSVADLAEKLVKLYAERQKIQGYAFSQDNEWQVRFEDEFPYIETDDQLVAIEEIKKDMESTRVMDRLLCGDVGYGKTEVAIRAAFKSLQDGKQVAILAPTTILVEQHFKTFTERMKDFPVKIEHLSRFRSAKEQKEAIKKMENGLSDLLIGTHRILSQDIKFKDLGLIVIDEEQRFGVLQKEKLKNIQKNVDVLSLSATPIPRTLHMSLSGIRDMSILEEAPRERQPIQTYVIEHEDTLVKNAIYKEVGRGGQVYYLYNRVGSINQVTEKLRGLMPEINIVHAHGQMNKRELEVIMEEFILGKIDVLVATSIIETGLDIPNVNTIIIHDADKMGLAQLYQLRGRVGRSSRIAYAYLMYKKEKVLKDTAEKRLNAIKEFTELGSGFKIAMRDLEIRGAGNLLGSEQHGHMETVGYDMYYKILDEAVRELKGEITFSKKDISIDINVNAYIPDNFIKVEMQKIEIYKKIASIRSLEDMREIEEEIEDRYGNIPDSVYNLLHIALMKSHASIVGIRSIIQKGTNIIIDFYEDASFDMEKLLEIIKKHSRKLSYTNMKKAYLTYVIEKGKVEKEIIKELTGIMENIE